MDYDIDKIDQTVLALLSLTLHDINKFGCRAWKGHDWDVLNRLHEKGWIGIPCRNQSRSVLTPEATAESKRLFGQLFRKQE